MACALFSLAVPACRAAKNTLREGLKAARHLSYGRFCPARGAAFGVFQAEDGRKHHFGRARRALSLAAGTNRAMAMSFSNPFNGLMPPLLLLGLCAATLLFDPLGAATSVRGRLFDLYENHAPHAPAGDGRVALVMLDSGSLAHYGRWPWTDAGLSDLSRAIALAGAEAIVFTAPLDRPQSGSFPAPLQSVPAVVPILLGVGGLTPRPVTHFEYRGTKNPFAAAPRFQQRRRAIAGGGRRRQGPGRAQPDPRPRRRGAPHAAAVPAEHAIGAVPGRGRRQAGGRGKIADLHYRPERCFCRALGHHRHRQPGYWRPCHRHRQRRPLLDGLYRAARTDFRRRPAVAGDGTGNAEK